MSKKLNKSQALFPWLRHKLRRLSYMWPEVKRAQSIARVSRGKYICAHCKEEEVETLWGPKQISRDHIEPVIPVTIEEDSAYMLKLLDTPEVLKILNCKKEDLQDFIKTFIFVTRLFCKAENYQVLCHEHHDIKSFLEMQIRAENKVKFRKKKKKS